MYVEWCETLWATLGGLGHITKYRTLLGRRIGIEHGATLHNLQQAKNLPRDLCSMLMAARAQYALGVTATAGDMAFLLMLGVTDTEVGEPCCPAPPALPRCHPCLPGSTPLTWVSGCVIRNPGPRAPQRA